MKNGDSSIHCRYSYLNISYSPCKCNLYCVDHSSNLCEQSKETNLHISRDKFVNRWICFPNTHGENTQTLCSCSCCFANQFWTPKMATSNASSLNDSLPVHEAPCFLQDQNWILGFRIAPYVLIFSVAVIGNILVMTVVYRNKTMKKTINFFIANMAFSDLIFTISQSVASLPSFYMATNGSCMVCWDWYSAVWYLLWWK